MLLVAGQILLAQETWEGEEGMTVVVTDERGQPVPGVLIVLLYGDEGVRGPSLTTGDDGVAEVENLAAGEWQVDLRRESFMLLTSYLKIDAGKEPEVAFSSRQRTGAYWAPLNAVYLPLGADLDAGVAAGTKSLKRAQRDQAREEKRLAKAAQREERRFRRGRSARVVDPVVPRRTSSDRVAAAPSPATGPALSRNPNLLSFGACRECREGEWSVTTSVRAPAGEGGTCSAPDWNSFADRLEAPWEGTRRQFAGGLLEEGDFGALPLLESEAVDALEESYPWLGRESSCSAIAVLLPAGSRYVGFRYQAGERATVADCLLGEDCQIGQARFVAEPQVISRDGFILVGSAFENQSPERARVGRLTVYFAPPAGWLPPN
ncbi:MAG: carboxypeptidase-like regulatory domain-containing protein [Acidobacteriota bacterium]